MGDRPWWVLPPEVAPFPWVLWGTAHAQGTTRAICGAPLPGEPSRTPTTTTPGWQGTLTQLLGKLGALCVTPDPPPAPSGGPSTVYPAVHTLPTGLASQPSPESGGLWQHRVPPGCQPSPGRSCSPPGLGAARGPSEGEEGLGDPPHQRLREPQAHPPPPGAGRGEPPRLSRRVGASWAGGLHRGTPEGHRPQPGTPSPDFPGADQVRQAAARRGDLQHQRAGGG